MVTDFRAVELFLFFGGRLIVKIHGARYDEEMMRRFGFLGLGGVVLAFFLAYAGACRKQGEKSRDFIVIGVLADVQSWNPYLTDTRFSGNLLALVYPSLMIEDGEYRKHPPGFHPALARSWEFSDDGLSIDFHLDARARWSDGKPIDSEDVVFSFEVQKSPEVGWSGASSKDFITSVVAIDARTVRFSFDHRYPYQLMDANDGLIVPAHAWKDIPFSRWTSTRWYPMVLAGGALRPVRHLPQQEIVLERNPIYGPGPPTGVSRFIWRIIPDQASLMTSLEAGELDFVPSVPPDQAERLQNDGRYRLLSYPDRGYTHVCWNIRNPLFSKRDVRKALSLAINRQTIIDRIYHGFAGPSRGPVLSSMWAFNHSLPVPEYNPSRARELLADCGWKDSDGDGILEKDGKVFELELLSNAGNRMRADIAMLISQDFSKIGVQATPRTLEWGTFLSRLESGNFDGAINRWIEPTQIDLEDVWHSAEPGAESSNFGGYSNSRVDQLIEEAAGLPEFGLQAPLFAEIQQLIVDDQPYAFLVESRRLNALSRRIEGAIINDATPYFNLPEWTLVQENR